MGQLRYGVSLSVDEARRRLTPVIAATCYVLGVSPDELVGGRRGKTPISEARQVVMFLGATRLRLSLPSIARVLNKADHTTVLHGRQVIARRLEVSPALRNTVAEIERYLEAMGAQAA